MSNGVATTIATTDAPLNLPLVPQETSTTSHPNIPQMTESPKPEDTATPEPEFEVASPTGPCDVPLDSAINVVKDESAEVLAQPVPPENPPVTSAEEPVPSQALFTIQPEAICLPALSQSPKVTRNPSMSPRPQPSGSPAPACLATPPAVAQQRTESLSPAPMSPNFDLAGVSSDDTHDNTRMEMDPEYRALHGNYVELEEQFGRLRERFEQLQGDYEEVAERNESRKATIEALTNNEEWYKNRMAALEAEAVEQQRLYDGLYQSANEKLSTAERELSEREKAVKVAQREAHSLKQEGEMIAMQLKTTKERLASTEKKLEQTTQQISECKERLLYEQAEALKAKVLSEERHLSLQAATQQLAQADKALEDSKVKNDARLNTLNAEIALMKARLAERDAELTQLQRTAAQEQHSQLRVERQSTQERLLHIITANGGVAPAQDQNLITYVELIGTLLQQKSQETAELLGYCQRLLDQKEVRV